MTRVLRFALTLIAVLNLIALVPVTSLDFDDPPPMWVVVVILASFGWIEYTAYQAWFVNSKREGEVDERL